MRCRFVATVRGSLIAAAVGLAAPATGLASSVMYTFGGAATGTLNGAAFNGASFTITAIGSTADITAASGATVVYSVPVQASVAIAGFPLATVTDTVRVFDNTTYGAVGFGHGPAGADLLDLNAQQFTTYNLGSDIGPVSVSYSGPIDGFVDVGTSAGPLTVSSIAGMRFGGQQAASVVWIPVVSHGPGAGGSQWRSDAGLFTDLPSGSVTATLRMHAGGAVAWTTTTVPGQGQIIVPDIAGALGVTDGSGALEVVADGPVAATSRTFNRQPSGLTYGQGYAGMAPAGGLSAGQATHLLQLAQDGVAGQLGTHRTNVGITNTGAATATVTLTLFDANGTQVWTDTRDYDPGQWYQYQEPYRTGAGRVDIGAGYAVVSVVAGSGVAVYASVIDNGSSDPTTITPWP